MLVSVQGVHIWAEQVREECEETKHWSPLWEEKEELVKRRGVMESKLDHIFYFLIKFRLCCFFPLLSHISKSRWQVLCLSSCCPSTFLTEFSWEGNMETKLILLPFNKAVKRSWNVDSIGTEWHIPEFEHALAHTHYTQIRKAHEKLWFIHTDK